MLVDVVQYGITVVEHLAADIGFVFGAHAVQTQFAPVGDGVSVAEATTVSMLLRGIERACSNCSSVKTMPLMRSPPFP